MGEPLVFKAGTSFEIGFDERSAEWVVLANEEHVKLVRQWYSEEATATSPNMRRTTLPEKGGCFRFTAKPVPSERDPKGGKFEGL